MAFFSALGLVANVGGALQIAQEEVHQRESVRWTARGYALDAHSMKANLLSAARDDIRCTYDTHSERLDSLLLFNALLLPFALNTLQFSEPFVPGNNCPYDPSSHKPIDVECKYPILHTIWVYLIAVDLIIPFWSIGLLLRCKYILDNWMSTVIIDINEARRFFVTDLSCSETSRAKADAYADETNKLVQNFMNLFADCQEEFQEMWYQECYPLVKIATKLLFSAACVAQVLTMYMFFIFLTHRTEGHGDAISFAVLCILGLSLPGVLWGYQWLRSKIEKNAESKCSLGTPSFSSGNEKTPSEDPCES